MIQLPDLVSTVGVRRGWIVFEDDFTIALDLDQGISGQNIIRKQGWPAMIGDGETE